MDRSNQHKGFTLLEVLVAMAVLTIALTSIYKLHGQTMVMSGKARFLTIAPQLAQAKLTEIEGGQFQDIGDGSGDFGEDHPNYQWKLTIEDIPTEMFTDDKKYHLVRININVTQSDDNSFQLQTYRFYTD
jgi:general secretion pathway protein I